MMKSFFKKLAFVMALAMVVSMVAPAAQKAVAAEDKALAIAYQKGAVITALNLAEVGATEDLRFVYAPENWKELGATWTSSNPNVVSVDANGVVEAKAAGTATVSVAVGAETASIEVYSVDMTTFVATMGNKEDRAKTELSLEVGEEFDFAFYGIKDYSVDRYNCEWWAVDPEGVIELDTSNGLVKAVKPGTAKLTLAVMNLVTLQKTDVAACVITVAAEEPEVAPNDFEITKMVSEYALELTFGNKNLTAEEIKAGLSAYYYVGDVKINFNGIKSVKVKDGVATVTMYSLLNDKTTYGFKFGDVEKETTIAIGTPTTLYLTWKDASTSTKDVAWAGYTTKFVPHILNENGAEITDTVTNKNVGYYYSYELAQESVYANYYLVDEGIYFTTPDVSAVVTATYYSGYDAYGQQVKTLVSVPTPITSSTKPAYTFAFQTPELSTVNGEINHLATTNIAIGDSTSTNPRYVGFKLKDSYGNTQLVGAPNTINDGDSNNEKLQYPWENGQNVYLGEFSFASDNPAIFTVDYSGKIVANAVGTANVLVYFDSNINNATSADKTLVAVVPVTVFPVRAVTTVTVKSATLEASTVAPYNTAKIVVELKDQMGDLINYNYAAGERLYINQKSVDVAGVSEPTLVPALGTELTQSTDNGNPVKGTYEATITCVDGDVSYVGGSRYIYYAVKFNHAERVAVSLRVVKPDTTQNSTYTFEGYATNSWTNDINVANGISRSFSYNLFERKSGIKVDVENPVKMSNEIWGNPSLATLQGTYVRVFKDGADITNVGTASGDALVTITGNNVNVKVSALVQDNSHATSYTIVDFAKGAGNYNIVAYKAVGTNYATRPSAMSQIASVTTNITNTQPTASYLSKRYDHVTNTVYAGNINNAAKRALEVKIGDVTFNNSLGWGSVIVEANGYLINNDTIYFASLDLYVPVDGFWGTATTYVKYTVPVGDYVNIKY